MTKIQIGNLNRGAEIPVLIKEKPGPNGRVIVKIYQRKDINSIDNLKDKLTTILKYSIEDFIGKHQLFAGLSKQMGFTRIEKLNIQGFDNAIGVLQTVKSGARINSIDSDQEKNFNKILSANHISQDYEINPYAGKAKPDDIIDDLNNLLKKNYDELEGISEGLEKIESAFKKQIALTREECFKNIELLRTIDNSLTRHFDGKITQIKKGAASQGKSPVQDQETKRKLDKVGDLKVNFHSQITRLEAEIWSPSFDYQQERDWIINKIFIIIKDNPPNVQKNIYKDVKSLAKDIDCLFSTSLWVSKGSKQEAADRLAKACREVPDSAMLAFFYKKMSQAQSQVKYEVVY